jgi:hypothetical protein
MGEDPTSIEDLLCDPDRGAHEQGKRVTRLAPHNFGGHIPHIMCSDTFTAVIPPVRICAGLCQERVPRSAMLYQR